MISPHISALHGLPFVANYLFSHILLLLFWHYSLICYTYYQTYSPSSIQFLTSAVIKVVVSVPKPKYIQFCLCRTISALPKYPNDFNYLLHLF